MPYNISSDCVACDSCRPTCPTGAIDITDGQYWINSALCDDCKNYDEPQCVISCPISLPTPTQAKRGRAKQGLRALTSPDLFSNGKNHPFASSIVIWEACNLLSQRHSLAWTQDEQGRFFYQRSLYRSGVLTLRIEEFQTYNTPSSANDSKVNPVESFDIRAACMHLIYAAHATALSQPWQQEFIIGDRQIEEYLGLDKRKDLTKAAKLTLMKEIVQQACSIVASMKCPSQGRIPGFSFEDQPLWHLLNIQHYFQEDEAGCKHLAGLSFTIRAGIWSKYFLNREGCKEQAVFYQYSTLPKSLLNTVMSIWQQHEGAARIMLWLLFKVRLGQEQRIMVPTLMRIAYGEKRLTLASLHREERKRLLRTFESDLEVLNHYGIKPVFDPETYPSEIQPLWVRLDDVPDDAEAALEFWINDGSGNNRLTDASPRGKWNLLMNARILKFDLPSDWKQSQKEQQKKGQKLTKNAATRRSQFKKQTGHNETQNSFKKLVTAKQIASTRKQLGISQRDLAEQMGKSQSWIRDVENERFDPKLEDQLLLKKILGLG
ncbi:MAG: helix-turn-helix domain-containing protein [Oculatellaceae cyanobacterium bins.114]|nr:helix-turn-helix domain-containing protein [Oculatellaceae cyanobacterium bins.114]